MECHPCRISPLTDGKQHSSETVPKMQTENHQAAQLTGQQRKVPAQQQLPKDLP